MNNRESQSLDRYLTGNYGEDQFAESCDYVDKVVECYDSEQEWDDFLDWASEKLSGLSITDARKVVILGLSSLNSKE